jgi:hypothetical protein
VSKRKSGAFACGSQPLYYGHADGKQRADCIRMLLGGGEGSGGKDERPAVAVGQAEQWLSKSSRLAAGRSRVLIGRRSHPVSYSRKRRPGSVLRRGARLRGPRTGALKLRREYDGTSALGGVIVPRCIVE